jgi:hypothetical protein
MTGRTLSDDERAAYVAEREAVQAEKIAASADRALGRRPVDLPGKRRARALLGDAGPRATVNTYNRLDR